VEQLQTEYAADQAVADRKHKRSILEIQGRVRGLAENRLERVRGVAFTENESHSFIVAYFFVSDSASPEVDALAEGLQLVLRCRVDGKDGGLILMRNCGFVR
jgi:hypothetical protein